MALPLMSYAGTCGSLAEGEGLKAEGEAKLSTRFCPENGFHDTSERRVLVVNFCRWVIVMANPVLEVFFLSAWELELLALRFSDLSRLSG